MLDPSRSVAETVLDHAETAAVFQRHRIDYCCKGSRTISAAAHDRGVDEAALLSELEATIAARAGDPAIDRSALSTPALIEEIVSTHHDYLRRTLPFLRTLAAKVARVHGEHDLRLFEVERITTALAEALLPHLDAEEQVVFPALVAAGAAPARVSAGLAEMADEHLEVGTLLAQLRDAADDYAVPDWACTSYRTLFRELAHLEDDVLRHVHLENYVLLPRFAG